jgi:hypothetical protein
MSDKPKFTPGSPEEMRRVVDDVLKASDFGGKSPELTPEQQLVERAKQVTRDVNADWKRASIVEPMLAFDKTKSGIRIANLYTEAFSKWSNEELLFLVVMMHTELTLEQM